jgi:hypothetical protein
MSAAVIGLLANPNLPESARTISDAQEAARTLGQQLLVLNASTPSEINTAFGTLRQRRAMPFAPCFHIEKTDDRSFRGSWMGFAYCDFTRRDVTLPIVRSSAVQ